MNRPKVSVFLATSLDGYIARPDHGLDWLSRVERDGEDYGFAKFFASVDAMVMGRGTYDVVADFDPWPYGDKRMLVLTTRDATSRHGEEFVAGAVDQVLSQLHAEGVGHVYLDGGNVVGQGLRAGVVDELTVSVIPVLLGEGIPLAPQIGRDVVLQLTGHRAFESGLVQLHYAVDETTKTRP